MSRRLSLSLVMVLAGTAVLTATGAPTGSAAETRTGGTLRLGTFQDVYYVDPALAYTAWSAPVTFATCAKLFNHPDESGAAGTRVIPEVVERYSVSKDGRVYTFDLKRTFRFHTGAAVTARSFADAFNRDAEPRLRSPATSFMHEIEGADAVNDGKSRSISGIRVLSRYRLQIRLTRPLGDFTARLTLPFFCPVLSNTPIDPDGIDNPAGSGPYYVAEWVVNQRIVLERNPYYRGNRPANVDRVVWAIGDTSEACLRAVEENRLDHCVHFGLAPTAFRELAEKYGVNRPGGQLYVTPATNTWYLAFNHERPAFRGPGQIPLKKAINYAIDRPALLRPVGYLGGKRTDQILPPSLGRAESIYPLGGPDLAAARRWYARAHLKPTTLVYYSTNAPSSVVQAQVLAFDLKQLGIDLEVKYFEAATLLEKISTRGEPFDLARNGWGADYADGGSFFSPNLDGRTIQATGNLNVAYFDDPRTNARIDAANKLTGEARRKAWENLDGDLMRQNPPWAPLYNSNGRAFVSKSFGCFLFHPLYGVDIAAACKK
jgi:peptide/nickel transport system substrate-binding protein